MGKVQIAALALLFLVLAALMVVGHLTPVSSPTSPTYVADLQGCLITEGQEFRCAAATEPAFVP
jgi:hypothetical protein